LNPFAAAVKLGKVFLHVTLIHLSVYMNTWLFREWWKFVYESWWNAF